ncbi:glycerol-3-phosphate dehydrogenase [Chitinimonas lacunae]|uniref:Glycerol-3-phosphate dehydrogenase n=1 Tax=Chitinimonas lacunae TaxID=1963018 RepID=A0ABV8MTK7_9NEIS
MTDDVYDLLVVGGGINGVGIANHAAQAGQKVLLVEQDDLAAATSSASSKLIHGGLRYLEHYEFRLVREALGEREVLLEMAPHLVRPMTFVLPHHPGLRPTWLIRLGLFFYDHLGGRRRLPGSHGLNLRRHPYGEPLQPQFRRGFSYADCWVDDARLVVANALQLRELGGEVLTRTRLDTAWRDADGWWAELAGPTEARRVRAKVLVNAAGPWVEQLLKQRLQLGARDAVRLVKGSHIVVPRLHEGQQAYILQHADNRIVFVLPYENDYSLIGTTDVPYDGDPRRAAIEQDEVAYLCELVSEYFARPVQPSDVVWHYAGVRPLYDDQSDDPSAVTRDYVLRLDRDGAPVLSVFGGKLTTYRQLALAALLELQPFLPLQPLAAKPPPLPGGDLPEADFEAFLTTVRQRYAALDPALLGRLARQFGSRIDRVLDGVSETADLGQHYGAGLYQCELDYLVAQEWATSADDVLWRRTKRGLHMTAAQRAAVARWFNER